MKPAPRDETPIFSGSYDPADCIFLMKPSTLAPVDVETKEALIQSGRRHYSEMLSAESAPGADYLKLYEEGLDRNAGRLAQDVVDLAAALAERRPGRPVVIASLARAGTPIGVLLKRALVRSGVEAHHYSLSIIRDRGIDQEALNYIAARHDPADVVFVDGWTGKGTITRELQASLNDSAFKPFLAVIADPAGCADLAPSAEDYLIPSGLLNSIVSGLVSRSILNEDLVKPGDFHACVLYNHLAPHDISRAFVDRIDRVAASLTPRPIVADSRSKSMRAAACQAMMTDLMAGLALKDRNRVKPGVAEATRAVLRRVPERLLVRDATDPDVAHLMLLAAEKGVPVEPLPGNHGYRAVTVIRTLGQD